MCVCSPQGKDRMAGASFPVLTKAQVSPSDSFCHISIYEKRVSQQVLLGGCCLFLKGCECREGASVRRTAYSSMLLVREFWTSSNVAATVAHFLGGRASPLGVGRGCF